jgi:hypothetical protein
MFLDIDVDNLPTPVVRYRTLVLPVGSMNRKGGAELPRRCPNAGGRRTLASPQSLFPPQLTTGRLVVFQPRFPPTPGTASALRARTEALNRWAAGAKAPINHDAACQLRPHMNQERVTAGQEILLCCIRFPARTNNTWRSSYGVKSIHVPPTCRDSTTNAQAGVRRYSGLPNGNLPVQARQSVG